MTVRADAPLAGYAVLVTRPAHQAAPLAALLASQGAEPVLLPAMRIDCLPEHPGLLAAANGLAAIDLAVFASANAVAAAWPVLIAAGGFPERTRVAAIGPATARALEERGVTDVLVAAAGADSEALLAHPALQDVAGRRVAIFCGESGRTLLQDTLRARRADVVVAICYVRRTPAIDLDELGARLAARGLHAVTFMSGETLRNLYGAISPGLAAELRRLPHIVNHENVAVSARACGAADITVGGSTDEAMVAALRTRFATVTPSPRATVP